MAANIFEDISLTIGRTPLVRLNRVNKGAKANILAKIESRNPTFSVKCRIGASMIWYAEKEGLLRPGMEIIEPTSGNTGIALAYVAAARGYSLTLTMPESMSIERRKIVRMLGANFVLTDALKGMQGSIDAAVDLVKSNPDKYYMPQQFENPANPAIHRETTGPEIWNDCDGKVDVIIAGVGTGGTITGIAQHLKLDRKAETQIIAVEPAESPVIGQSIRGEPISPGRHNIQGIGAGFLPKNLDITLIDGVEAVHTDEALDNTRRLAREEGILTGISSGAAFVAAMRLAVKKEYAGKNIVVIFPDAGERYLSTNLFDGLFQDMEAGG